MIENDLKRLDELVKKMEAGELALEETLKVFDEGVQLVRKCTQELQSAELKVKEILEKKGSFSEEPLR